MAGCITCGSDLKQLPSVERGRPKQIPDQFVRQVLEQAVLRVFMVASADLWSDTRGRPNVAFARQVAMYLAHVVCGLSLTNVGHIFSRDRTTVAHACGRVEDLRDDPAFDRSLELLEGIMRVLLPTMVPAQHPLRTDA
jgi:chromosomal replication initiation ATPase DnaA